MKRLGEMCFAPRFKHRQISEDRAHVARAISRGHMCMNLIGERDEADGVLLPAEQIRERRRQKLSVLQLRY